MCRTKEVQNYLYRIESIERNLNKKSVPVTHGAIPKARKFECLKFSSLIALRTDKAGILVHILEKIKLFSLIIAEAAHQIHRIEMRGTCKRVA